MPVPQDGVDGQADGGCDAEKLEQRPNPDTPRADRTHQVIRILDTNWIEEQGFNIEYATIMKKDITYVPWTTQSNTSKNNLTKLNELFINAPPEAKTLFDIKITNGSVESFSNLKLLLKATRLNQ